MTSPYRQAAPNDPARTPTPPDVPQPTGPPETPTSPPEQVPSREPVGVPASPEPLGVPPTAPPEVPSTGAAQARSGARERCCLFDTAIGACGIAWNARGVTRLQLPEKDRAATERRLRAGGATPADAPPAIRAALADIARYFAGEEVDFSSIAVDVTHADSFAREVYAAARAIGWGRTTTYGELARLIGSPDAARDVGQALGRNRAPIIIPCHRILAKGNALGGFSAYGGTRTKLRLLELEGVHVGDGAPRLPGL